MKQLSASKERALKNAVILAAQSFVFQALTQHYGLSHQLFKFCTKIGSGSTPKGGKAIYVSDGIPFIRSLNVRHYEFNEENLARIPLEIKEAMSGTCVLPGDVYLNITGASIGRSCCAPEKQCPANVSQHVCIIRPIKELLDSRFLMYWLNDSATQEEINTIQKGATRQALTKRQIENFRLPAVPLSEQKEVAAFLEAVRLRKNYREIKLPLHLQHIAPAIARIEELAAKVEEARGLRRQSAEEADGLLKTTISNLFLKGAKEGWTGGRLGDYVLDDCYGTSERTTEDESGTPILRMGNIQNGCLDLRDLKYFHLAEKERQKLLLKKGDILVNRTNSAELVGKCAVFDIEGEYAFASYIIRLRLDLERADPRLVAAYINSPAGRTYMFSERKQMTGQANVNATQLKALPIALPPLSEQRRIVAYLNNLQSKVNSLKRLQTETAAELDALLPSILDKAFKGEL
jgi:type I restriction enzyme S subunit